MSGLSDAALDDITATANGLIANGAGLDEVARRLRADHPGLTVTLVAEDDMPDSPYRAERDYLLFLVDRRDHCWTITDNPESASGLVLALRERE